jgi:hypothetical protein
MICAMLYFALGGTGRKHENTTNKSLCGTCMFFHVFIWRLVTFGSCTLSVFMWHKWPNIKFSAQLQETIFSMKSLLSGWLCHRPAGWDMCPSIKKDKTGAVLFKLFKMLEKNKIIQNMICLTHYKLYCFKDILHP